MGPQPGAPLYASYDPALVPLPPPPPAASDTVSTPNTATAPVIDGNLGEYTLSTSFTRSVSGTSDNSASFGTKWDNNYLYVGIKVLDASLQNDSPENWKDDGIELYIDADHNKGATYDSFDRQFVLGWNDNTLTEQNGNTTGVLFAQKNITGGYQMELAIPWGNLGVSPTSGKQLGFDLGVNDDDDGGGRDGQLMWAGTSDNFKNTSAFGTAVLGAPASSSFTLEAENATLSQAVVDNIHAGYTGTGFVDYTNVAGSYVEWTVNVATAGSYQLTFRYANGSTVNRPCTIRANGTVVNSGLAFNPSGAWTTYQYSSTVTVTLNAGQNTVRATANVAAGGPNMDHLKVTGSGTTQMGSPAAGAAYTILEPLSAPAGGIQVYPNPTSGQIRITGAGTENAAVRIYDQQGRLMLSGRLDGGNGLDVSNLSRGVYVLEVEVKGGQQTFRTKLLKE